MLPEFGRSAHVWKGTAIQRTNGFKKDTFSSRTSPVRPGRGISAPGRMVWLALGRHLGDEWTMRLVTLCGSLRARSSNRALLQAYARLAPPSVTCEHYERLGALPHFNPDLDGATPPPEVQALRALVAGADVVVISTPEYVHALPGSFKNALDWLVADPTFAGQAVVILHVDRGSPWALDSLTEVLRTMSAKIIEPASVLIPLTSNQVDADAILAREEFRRQLQGSLDSLPAFVKPRSVPPWP